MGAEGRGGGLTGPDPWGPVEERTGASGVEDGGGEPKFRPFRRPSRGEAEEQGRAHGRTGRRAPPARRGAGGARTAAKDVRSERARVSGEPGGESWADRSRSGSSMSGLAALGRAGARAADQPVVRQRAWRRPPAPTAGTAGIPRRSRSGSGLVPSRGRHVRRRSSRERTRSPSWGKPKRSRLARAGTAFLVVLLAALVFGAYVGVQALRPVPRPHLAATARTTAAIPGHVPALPWPGHGAEAEVEVTGVGRFGPAGPAKPTAIGSVAKVMTAYVVLRDHPLRPKAGGPVLTVTPADVRTYLADVHQGDSVVGVVAGEHLTERQALEALLVPSGDNIANMLATWDAGSVPAFVAKMNAVAGHLGLHHTHYADPSGLSGRTVSTPSDQLALAPVAMANPTFAQIVAMAHVTLPVVGVVSNYNSLLGHRGVIGIKTGSTPTSSGCLLFAARHRAGSRTETIYGAVLGAVPAPGQGFIPAAIQDSLRLIAGVEARVHPVTILPAGFVAADVVAPWGARTPAQAVAPVTVLGWPGLRVRIRAVPAGPLQAGLAAGSTVGELEVGAGSQMVRVGLQAGRNEPSPPLSWRLGRI